MRDAGPEMGIGKMTRLVTTVASLAIGLTMTFHVAAQDTKSHHFFDAIGNSLEKFDGVWASLNQVFGNRTPVRIRVLFTDGPHSKFSAQADTILIKTTHYNNHPIRIVAHESAHLAMAKLTRGASRQGRYRFIDEGFASLFGSGLAGEEKTFRRDVLTVAAHQHRRGNVDFDLVQDWRSYKEIPAEEVAYTGGQINRYAYAVGASFVFYLLDTHGLPPVMKFFEELGIADDLDTASRRVLDKSKAELETGWLSYLYDVELPEDVAVEVVRMTPSNGAKNVPIDITELEVEFNTPMLTRSACIGTATCREICYRNAYWKSPTVMAIKVDGKLKPHQRYGLTLGLANRCRLHSVIQRALPVTSWSFQTGN